MCLAFGVERLDDVGARARRRARDAAAARACARRCAGCSKLKSIADSRPKTVAPRRLPGGRADRRRRRPRPAADPDLLARATPAPFITLPAVITHDPQTGTRNVGMYRMQKLDRRTTLMHWQIHKDGRMDYLATDGRLEVAVALGLDPITRLLGVGAAAQAHRRVHDRRLPRAATPVEHGAGEDGRPRGAGRRRDRARGLRPAGRARRPRGRSATTPATTRASSRSRSSTSPR